jgi:putative transcriptional regulator
MTHLTPDILLMRYAAGVLPPYESMVMAAYLSVSAEARRQLATFEAAGGRMIERTEPVNVSQGCLDAILAVTQAIPSPCTGAASPCAQVTTQTDEIPPALRQLVESHCPQQQLRWQRVAPGISIIDITLCHSEPRARRLRLMRLAPGQATPAHHHTGTEITLVLEGSFHDETGAYRRGDLVVITDPAVQHSPRAGDCGCLCLTLTEAPLRFDSLVMQMLGFLRRF